MFTNKHVVIAMIVAPILALLAYFGVDAMVSEKPNPAQKGQSYKLLSKSNCRYESGICSMVNGDVELDMQLEKASQGIHLAVHSNLPLEGVQLAMFEQGNEAPPKSLNKVNQDPTYWLLPLTAEPKTAQTIRLVVEINGTYYYGETGSKFFDYKTADGKDFRKEAIR